MSFLWAPTSFWGWLGSIVAQFVVFVGLLTPIWARLKRLYDKQLNPYSPGGAGDVPAPDGRPMHVFLAERRARQADFITSG